jgi:translocation and assembly module TamA
LALAACRPCAAAPERVPCPQLLFVGPGAPALSDVERKLVCGDPRTEGWKQVPLNQAEYLLRAFLQARGYLEPRFRRKGAYLEVDVGERTTVESITARGLPQAIDPSKLRKLRGAALTPRQLDKIKSALFDALQHRGYACPKIEMSGYADTGLVVADVAPGPLYRVPEVQAGELKGADPRVSARYEAFRRGGPFDMRLFNLTAERALADGLFVSAYYDVSCSSAGLAIAQRVVEGKPQVYKAGVGFDTEYLAIGKAQWRNSRIGPAADSLQGSLFASYREQSAETSMQVYPRAESRLHLAPKGTYKRLNEVQFESLNAELALPPAMSWESQELRLDVSAGPALDHVRTIRGPGAPRDTFFAFDTAVDVKDHMLEYYAGNPRAGWRTSFASSSRMAGTYSSLTAHRFSGEGEALWNLGNYDPPLAVLGTRWSAGTIYVNDQAAALQQLPPESRFYLGGDSNLRGAARKELPGDDAGFFTAVYDGLELRMGDVLPYGIEPLGFVDAAMGSRRGFRLDPDVYWSPGAGLRWRLPLGSIRGTLARGLVWHRDPGAPPLQKPHWQLFFSFGREF